MWWTPIIAQDHKMAKPIQLVVALVRIAIINIIIFIIITTINCTILSNKWKGPLTKGAKLAVEATVKLFPTNQ